MVLNFIWIISQMSRTAYCIKASGEKVNRLLGQM